MKAEFINPFTQATFDVLNMVGAFSPKIGKLGVTNTPIESPGVSSIIGIIGDVKGQVIYSFNEETGKNIASTMMMGMPVDSFDEMAKSAVSELSNMISGNASTGIAALGVTVDISPPSLITGSGISISSHLPKMLVVPIETTAGVIEIYVGLE